MNDFLNTLIDQSGIPLVGALALGIMTSLSPCPLATNITAVAYISKEVHSPRAVLLNSLAYTFGRAVSYLALSMLIVFGISTLRISSLFQGWGDKVLGPFLIIIGLVMLDIIKINGGKDRAVLNNIKLWLAKRSYLGSLALGMIFALAFCPYSGVLFFGALIPLVLRSTESVLLAPAFALGTAIPVILFALVISMSYRRLNRAFMLASRVERFIRSVAAVLFVLSGIYYSQFLIRSII
ncbi:MAG TPA: aromatic aminobenezylarsenical efflux permease ArsG family transporter [bacterium]|nr:aromatic aminobenezylarsenical efflux permease ArsG family transporter [bacterium]